MTPEEAAEFRTLRRTADYIERVETLIAGGQLRGAWRFGLAGLAFEHGEAGDNFGTHYEERIQLLRLLEQVAAESDRPDAAATLLERAEVLRRHADDQLR